MKVDTIERDVLTNAQNESQFTINASPHAFKILSDGLYEHKVAAIVRELSCNAYDAHIENGTADEPFKVVLPNNLHPYFEIEDFGVGLDDEGVRNVYTSYFTSTKQDSNEAIGAFGLGSKTPFAYTSSFSIRARKNGIERFYSAYLGSNGAPCVNLMLEKETQETSGVKITVPVKAMDFNKFSDEAQFILSFFKTPPIVTDPNFETAYPDIVSELEEKNIVLRDRIVTGSSLYHGSIYAVMGGVCYRINQSYSLEDPKADKYLNSIVLKDVGRYYASKKVAFIRFDIGDLEVAASRETLSMDEKTQQAINEKLTLYVTDLIERDKEILENFNHPIEAYRYFADLYGSYVVQYGPFSYKNREFSELAHKRIWSYYGIEFCYDSALRHHKRTRLQRKRCISIDQLASSGTTIKGLYFNHGEKKSNHIHYLKEHVLPSRGNHSIVLLCTEPTTEEQRTRFGSYLGTNIEWIHLDNLKKQYPKQSTQQGSFVSTATGKLNDHVLKSTSIQSLSGSHFADYYMTRELELDEYTYSVDELDKESGSIACRGRTYRLSSSDIELILKRELKADSFDANIKLIPVNGKTKGKLDRNNVESFDTLVESFLQSNLEDIKRAFILNSLSYHEKTLLRSFQPERFKETYKDLFDLIDTDELKLSMMFERRALHEYELDVQDEKERYRKLLNDYSNDIRQQYPMIEILLNNVPYNMSTIFNTSKDQIDAYIDLVDSQ